MTDLGRLFEAFLAGDSAAFGDLYRELNPRLYAYCRKLAPDTAEDTVQMVWERVIEMRSKRPSSPSSERGGAVSSPEAFLFRTARNLIIDEYRRRKSEVGILNEEKNPIPHSSFLIPHSSEPTDLECIILDALEKLSFDDREVLVLNIYSGYKFGEIAEMQSKSVDAVWARASRARVRLREIVMSDAKRLGISIPVNHPPTPSLERRGSETETEVTYG